jgi:hypothetical protein
MTGGRRCIAVAGLPILLGGVLLGAVLLSADCLFSGPIPALADEAAAIKIAPGLYKAAGKTPAGKTYDGDVEIAPLGKVLAVLWRLGTGDAYKGIGLESGSVFGVAYSIDRPFGLVIYRIKGGELDGRWSLAAENGAAIGREILQGPVGLDGVYKIAQGENPNGTAYTGTVEIKPNGKTYTLRWFTPEPAEVGTGILMDRMLVVAYGRDPGFGVVAYHRDGDLLRGLWAATLATDLGSEDLSLKTP